MKGQFTVTCLEQKYQTKMKKIIKKDLCLQEYPEP